MAPQTFLLPAEFKPWITAHGSQIGAVGWDQKLTVYVLVGGVALKHSYPSVEAAKFYYHSILIDWHKAMGWDAPLSAKKLKKHRPHS